MAARLLVLTRTAGYRHDSLTDAGAAVDALGAFDVEHTGDPAVLKAPLDEYAAALFLSISGGVLTRPAASGSPRTSSRAASAGRPIWSRAAVVPAGPGASGDP
ncbi:hypothetical protein [Streptomyces sp. NPDC047706]|uniref:hypothetical protein n=1 Tax=Streptomyces sp. NPDC047706 TaxID=3365486 RepID=UPI003715AFAD